MKLYGSPTSPYVRKVRIVLAEKQIEYEFIRGSANAPDSPVPGLNPLGKVPTLVRDDGGPLYDSPVIVEYLDAIGGGPMLIPPRFADRIEVKRWEALGDGITDATVLVSHDYRKPAERRETQDWYQRQTQKIERGLRVMERDLAGREWCFGAGFSLADVAAGFALGYIDHAWPRLDWRPGHPNLKRLADKLASRTSFNTTLPPKP